MQQQGNIGLCVEHSTFGESRILFFNPFHEEYLFASFPAEEQQPIGKWYEFFENNGQQEPICCSRIEDVLETIISVDTVFRQEFCCEIVVPIVFAPDLRELDLYLNKHSNENKQIFYSPIIGKGEYHGSMQGIQKNVFYNARITILSSNSTSKFADCVSNLDTPTIKCLILSEKNIFDILDPKNFVNILNGWSEQKGVIIQRKGNFPHASVVILMTESNQLAVGKPDANVKLGQLVSFWPIQIGIYTDHTLAVNCHSLFLEPIMKKVRNKEMFEITFLLTEEMFIYKIYDIENIGILNDPKKLLDNPLLYNMKINVHVKFEVYEFNSICIPTIEELLLTPAPTIEPSAGPSKSNSFEHSDKKQNQQLKEQMEENVNKIDPKAVLTTHQEENKATSIAQTKADGYIKTNIQSESMPILESKDTTEQQSGNKQHLQMNNEVINPIKVLTIQEENKETLSVNQPKTEESIVITTNIQAANPVESEHSTETSKVIPAHLDSRNQTFVYDRSRLMNIWERTNDKISHDMTLKLTQYRIYNSKGYSSFDRQKVRIDGQQKFPRRLDTSVCEYEYAIGMVVDRQFGMEHFIYKIWPFYTWPFSEIKLSTRNNLRLGQWIKFKLSTTLAEFGNIHSQSWETLEHDPIPTFPCLGQVMIECEIKISTQSNVHKILQTLTSLPNTSPMQLYGKILSNGDLFEQLMKFPIKEQRFVVLKFLSTGEWQLQFIRPKCYQPQL